MKLSGKSLAAEIPRDANAISFINQALAYSLPENSPQNKLQIDKGLIHQLAEKEADFLILNADNPNSVVSYLISGKSTLLKLLPERAAELNEKVIYNINPPVLPLGINTPDKEAQALLATGTPEKILSEAEKYQPPLRDTFYTIAAAKIASAGDMNRAKGILSEHFSGERLASLYANLNARLAATATAKGEYDKAFEYIEQTNSPGRYITLISLATTIQTKANDNQKARTILARARQLISPTINTREDFEKWARMASAYALIDPATGFQMFETLVRKGDMILSASVVADAFQTSLPSIRNNEYMINNYTFIRLPVSNIVMNNFVKADPARTLKILNRIKRPELRLNLELQVFENNFRLTGGGIGIGIGSGVSTGIYSIEQ